MLSCPYLHCLRPYCLFFPPPWESCWGLVFSNVYSIAGFVCGWGSAKVRLLLWSGTGEVLWFDRSFVYSFCFYLPPLLPHSCSGLQPPLYEMKQKHEWGGRRTNWFDDLLSGGCVFLASWERILFVAAVICQWFFSATQYLATKCKLGHNSLTHSSIQQAIFWWAKWIALVRIAESEELNPNPTSYQESELCLTAQCNSFYSPTIVKM